MEKTKKEIRPTEVAEIQLSYKSKVKVSSLPVVSTSRDASNWDDNKIEFVEQFKILLLNRNNRVLGIFEVSTGGISGTVADPKLIFVAALKANASSIILAHNHPSGNLNPSEQDMRLTKRVKEAGNMLELPVLDHVIVTPEGYYSFADEGVL